jgi:hypothetical protein
MKRWAIVTVALYVVAVLLLIIPVFLIAFGGWAAKPQGIADILRLYSWYGFWIWLAVLALGQALFLLVPIHIAERRLSARRPVRIPAIVTAFFLANLLFAGALSLGCAVLKDGASDTEEFVSFPNILLVCAVIFWILWAIVFRRFANSDNPEAFVSRSVRWLLRGSILELLVAIPSHIIVRRRDDCCAPVITFWGIATGISVMLLCFGPGVYFLFVERFQSLQTKGNRK